MSPPPSPCCTTSGSQKKSSSPRGSTPPSSPSSSESASGKPPASTRQNATRQILHHARRRPPSPTDLPPLLDYRRLHFEECRRFAAALPSAGALGGPLVPDPERDAFPPNAMHADGTPE